MSALVTLAFDFNMTMQLLNPYLNALIFQIQFNLTQHLTGHRGNMDKSLDSKTY